MCQQVNTPDLFFFNNKVYYFFAAVLKSRVNKIKEIKVDNGNKSKY